LGGKNALDREKVWCKMSYKKTGRPQLVKSARCGLVFSLLAGVWVFFYAMYLVAYSLPAPDGYMIPVSSAALYKIGDIGKSIFMVPRG
jgi:hypothetical protein